VSIWVRPLYRVLASFFAAVVHWPSSAPSAATPQQPPPTVRKTLPVRRRLPMSTGC
jgi:hypothetical protein